MGQVSEECLLSSGSQSYIQIHFLKEMPEQSSVLIQLHSDNNCTYNAHLKWYNIVIIKHNANASTHWQHSLSSVQVMSSAKTVGYRVPQHATNAHQDCSEVYTCMNGMHRHYTPLTAADQQTVDVTAQLLLTKQPVLVTTSCAWDIAICCCCCQILSFLLLYSLIHFYFTQSHPGHAAALGQALWSRPQQQASTS